jgi:hypothetical protein
VSDRGAVKASRSVTPRIPDHSAHRVEGVLSGLFPDRGGVEGVHAHGSPEVIVCVPLVLRLVVRDCQGFSLPWV